MMERIRALGARLKRARLLPHLLFGLAVLLVLWRLLSLGLMIRSQDSFAALPQALWTVTGYDVTGDAYTRTDNDAEILITGWDRPVCNILVSLADPAERDTDVTLFYTRAGDEGETEWRLTTQLPAGDQRAAFRIPTKRLGSLRVVTDTPVGQGFSMDGIFVSERLTGTQASAEFYCWAVALACLLGVWLTVWCFLRRLDLSLCYLAAALSLGLGMMFAITPFSPPDELHHYGSTYYLASRILGQDTVPAEHYRYTDFPQHQNAESAYRRVIGELFRAQPGAEKQMPLRNPSGGLYYPPQYLPGALGIVLAKALGLNFLGVFYWGRFGTLLFSVLCVFLALRKLKHLRPLFFLLGLTPMFLQQAASFSYDAFANALSMLLLAWLFSAIYEEGPLPVRDRIAILLCTALLAPSKGAYFLLVLLALLIPRARYRSIMDKTLSTLSYLFAGCLTLIPFNWGKLLGILSVGGGTSLYYTPTMALRFPAETLRIWWRSLEQLNTRYLFFALGESLSGLNLALPFTCVLLFLLLPLLAVLPARKQLAWIPTAKHRLAYLGVFALILLLVYGSQFFSWTYIGENIIRGVQGRYLIPILPLLFVSLRGRSVTRTDALERPMLLLGIGALVWCVWYVARFTVGMV